MPALSTPAGAAPRVPCDPRDWKHAVPLTRGLDIAVRGGRTREGRFGVMFKNTPAFQPPEDLLRALAVQMGEPATPAPTDFDNPRFPAGFTFLGQFVDHDACRFGHHMIRAGYLLNQRNGQTSAA